jgi:hypothetical protein
MYSSRVLCDASSIQRPPYKRRCLPTLLNPTTLTHPFLLPAATSTNCSMCNNWPSKFSLNPCLGLGFLLYGLVWDSLCAVVFPLFSFICVVECCFVRVRQHHASVLSCCVFVKRWILPGLGCRRFFGNECDIFIPVFVLFPTNNYLYLWHVL